jgi:hypothetical protein
MTKLVWTIKTRNGRPVGPDAERQARLVRQLGRSRELRKAITDALDGLPAEQRRVILRAAESGTLDTRALAQHVASRVTKAAPGGDARHALEGMLTRETGGGKVAALGSIDGGGERLLRGSRLTDGKRKRTSMRAIVEQPAFDGTRYTR